MPSVASVNQNCRERSGCGLISGGSPATILLSLIRLDSVFFFLKFIFFYLFLAVPGFNGGVWGLVPRRDRARAPCTGSVEAQLLDHQGLQEKSLMGAPASG